MVHEDENPSLEKRHPPPEAWQPARTAAKAVIQPLERFLHVEAASGLVLLVMAVVAMIWANSPFAETYHHLFHTEITLGIGDYRFVRDLHFWINDGLMVIFFFVVGLEIRREIHAGELSELKRASLPIAAALGGMLLPAVIYLASTRGAPEASRGWGVPMATDIAFAVGILALLGRRVPAALRVLLLALAIIDDIGAILVIAIFYSEGVQLAGIALAAGGILLILAMQRIGVRPPILYVAPGVVIWAGMLLSGIHPTIAGVIIGLLTPVRSWFGERGFLEEATRAIREFQERGNEEEQLEPLDRLDKARKEAVPPVLRLQSFLHPYVAFLIMPIFALANAGVSIGDVELSAQTLPMSLGIGGGLVVGKTVGILGASTLAVKLGISKLPRGVDWRGLLIVGLVGGIGFTMALFIAALAFAGEASLLGVAKLAVLIGSTTAGVLGLALGFWILPKKVAEGAALSVGEAERSTDA